jgi:hypothetical protein
MIAPSSPLPLPPPRVLAWLLATCARASGPALCAGHDIARCRGDNDDFLSAKSKGEHLSSLLAMCIASFFPVSLPTLSAKVFPWSLDRERE